MRNLFWMVVLSGGILIAQSQRSVWDGVYTAAQARRGQTLSGEECARCHSETLGGGEAAPALAGDGFVARWQNAGELFEKIRTTMPTDSPGRLGRQEYADILAYILSVNKFPAGAQELGKDAAELSAIRIEPAKR
jgi:mono/diheme cytochrome c family protein